MGRHSIVEKLERALARHLATEGEVVYFLVELGKMLEHDNAKNRFPVVNFYRNWVAHTKLSNSAIADKIDRYFDDVQIAAENGSTWVDQSKSQVSLIDHTSLRNELKSCLEKCGLPSAVFSDNLTWLSFLTLLGEIVSDCPLTLKPKYATQRIEADHATPPTRFVKSVSIMKLEEACSDDALVLSWKQSFHTQPSCGISEIFVFPRTP